MGRPAVCCDWIGMSDGEVRITAPEDRKTGANKLERYLTCFTRSPPPPFGRRRIVRVST